MRTTLKLSTEGPLQEELENASLILGRRFLVVDDDPLILEITRDRLAHAGADVWIAEGTDDIAGAAGLHRPDFVLIDIQMGPREVDLALMTDLAEALNTRERRVILHSGISATELFRYAHRLGALGAIQKTGDERLFLHRVERLLDLHRAISLGATERPSVPY